MQIPDDLDIRLLLLPGQPSAACAIVAPAPLKADLSLFTKPGCMSAMLTHDPGLDWPDRRGERLAEAMLREGRPVGFVFASLADALACHRRLVREAAR